MPRAEIAFAGLPLATSNLVTFAEPFLLPDGVRNGKPGIRLALQEVVNDLYDGFLSKQDRKIARNRRALRERAKIKKDVAFPQPNVQQPPAVEISAAPDLLVPSFTGPTVEFPAWQAQPEGVPAWVSLAHETCGHAILQAYGLDRKFRNRVTRQLGKREGERWKVWFEEAASDCLAVLNMGPAMALGSVASWRAQGALVSDGKARLPCAAVGPETEHPPPVVRAYLMAHVLGLLRSRRAQRIGAAIKRLIRSELKACQCGKRRLEAAETVARVVIASPHPELNGFCFLDLQNWEVHDDAIVGQLRAILRAEQPPRGFRKGHFAGHAVAAAIIEKVTRRPGGAGNRVLPNLVELLRRMYQSDRGRKTRGELHIGT